jgi:hypothetical protein
MFEEIAPPPAPPSQRASTVGFAIFFASFLIGSTIAWFRWSGPMSFTRKLTAMEFIVGGVLSWLFLLTVKSATPDGNRKRMFGLFFFVGILQMIVDVLQ